MLNCLNYLEGQEGQLPNIRTMLVTILTVPQHLRAQPTWYTSTVYSCKVRSGISARRFRESNPQVHWMCLGSAEFLGLPLYIAPQGSLTHLAMPLRCMPMRCMNREIFVLKHLLPYAEPRRRWPGCQNGLSQEGIFENTFLEPSITACGR